MASDTASIAFYAPMKPPDHPTPSGDRQIARHLLAALRAAGLAPEVMSSLRTLDIAGDSVIQADLTARAEAEVKCLISTLAATPPALWFTYHCYYKAPDLLGPRVSRALAIPYQRVGFAGIILVLIAIQVPAVQGALLDTTAAILDGMDRLVALVL